MTDRFLRPDGESIAYHRTTGKGPGVMFCGGFMSDMAGTKALALEAHCLAQGRAFLRFDYLGHGESSGDFIAKGCISRWVDDAAAALQNLTEGPQIIVGSSMGGWIALRLALAFPERIAGLVGIAAAPDFTTRMAAEMSAAQRARLDADGLIRRDSDYDPEGYVITRLLLDDGADNLVLAGGSVAVNAPVRLLHGMADQDAPWQWSLDIAEALTSADVRATLIKAGDHRLSTPEDLALLCATVDGLAAGPSD